MKRLAWRAPNGDVIFATPVGPALDGETEDQYLDRIANKTEVSCGWVGYTRLPNCEATEQADRQKRSVLQWDPVRKEFRTR